MSSYASRTPVARTAGLGPLVLVGGATVVLAVGLASQTASLRVALAASAVVFALGLGLFAPRWALYFLFVWLPCLGLVRRLLEGIAPAPAADPLLLLAPAVTAVLLVWATHQGAFRGRTHLSNAVAALSIIAIVAAVNPSQGSMFQGIASLLLIVVPLGAFWIGRVLHDRSLQSDPLDICRHWCLCGWLRIYPNVRWLSVVGREMDREFRVRGAQRRRGHTSIRELLVGGRIRVLHGYRARRLGDARSA